MLAEFKYAHFAPAGQNGVYVLYLFDKSKTELVPYSEEELQEMDRRVRDEVFRNLERRASLMVTLTAEGACALTLSGLGEVYGFSPEETTNVRNLATQRAIGELVETHWEEMRR